MILDTAMSLPIGVAGEIHIGGPRGGMPWTTGLTSEGLSRILSLPMPALVYIRTGDRGRWRSDGQLQHSAARDQGQAARLPDRTERDRASPHAHNEVEQAVLSLPIYGEWRCTSGGLCRRARYVSARYRVIAARVLRSQLPEYMVLRHLCRATFAA